MKGTMALRLGLAIAAVLMAASAWAQMPGGGGPGMGPGAGMDAHRPPFERAFGGHGVEGRWWNNPRIVERLKLTDEQRKEFDNILLQHRETLVDLRANVEKAELEMEPLVRDDQPNEAKILAQIDKVAQARAELEKANARYLLALRSKLTPEQWKQVQDFRQNHGMRKGEDRGYGQGGYGNGGYGGRMRGGRGPGNNGPNTAPSPAGKQGPPQPPAGAGPSGTGDDQ
ncbi:MAG: Spy/CpxP family protein refolding chaperone [Terracidiphilus sp.]